MLSILPPGQQEIANQYRAISLELMVLWVSQFGWVSQMVSNYLPNSTEKDVRSTGHIAVLMSDLWNILQRADPQTAVLERFICMSLYVRTLNLGYPMIVQNAPIFQTLRAEASDFIYKYQPLTPAELHCLINYSMYVINSWKTGGVPEQNGRQLVQKIRYSFLEMQKWEVVRDILLKFPTYEPYLIEWKNNWLQGSSSD